jgi:hypothetical protein
MLIIDPKLFLQILRVDITGPQAAAHAVGPRAFGVREAVFANGKNELASRETLIQFTIDMVPRTILKCAERLRLI